MNTKNYDQKLTELNGIHNSTKIHYSQKRIPKSIYGGLPTKKR